MISRFILPKFNNHEKNDEIKNKNININLKISEFFTELNFEKFKSELINKYGEEN